MYIFLSKNSAFNTNFNKIVCKFKAIFVNEQKINSWQQTNQISTKFYFKIYNLRIDILYFIRNAKQ